MKKYLFLFLILFIFPTIIYADKTADDVFTRLDFNTYYCAENCYAIYTITNPYDTSIQFTIDHDFEIGNINSYKIFEYETQIETTIWKNCTEFQEVRNTSYCQTWKNVQEKNVIEKDNLKEITNKKVTIPPGGVQQIKITGIKDPGVTVDWIPSVTFTHGGKTKTLKQKKWALWTSSYYADSFSYWAQNCGNTLSNPTSANDQNWNTYAQITNDCGADFSVNFYKNYTISPQSNFNNQNGFSIEWKCYLPTGTATDCIMYLWNYTAGALQNVRQHTGGEVTIHENVSFSQSETADFLNATNGMLQELVIMYSGSGKTTRFYESMLILNWTNTSLPIIDPLPTNQSIDETAVFNYTLYGFALDTNISSFFINDTTLFNYTVNGSYGDTARKIEINSSALSKGTYSLNITLNDTLNNHASYVFYIVVGDFTNPTWNQTPTDQSLYVNEKAPWFYQINASDTNGIANYLINDTDYFQIDADNGTITTNATTNIDNTVIVSANDTSGNQINKTITLTYIQNLLYNCTENATFLLIFRNETDNSNMLADIETTISSNYPIPYTLSFEADNVYNYSICTFSPNTIYTIDALIQYSDSPDYDIRQYYLTSANTTNKTQTIYLYLNKDATTTTINIDNTYGIGAAGDLIIAERYDVGTNIFTTVTMTKTNAEGAATIFLEKPAWYRFIIQTSAGASIRIYDPMFLTGNSLSLRYSDAAIGVYYDVANAYTAVANYNNVTGYLTATATDTSGLARSWWFTVTQNGSYVCNQSATTASATFNCLIPGESGSYIYRIVGDFDGQDNIPVLAGVLDFLGSLGFGSVGIIASLLLFLTLPFAIAYIENPVIPVILAMVAVVTMNVMGFFSVTEGSIIGLLIAGVIVIKKIAT